MPCATGLLRWGSSISSAEAAGRLIIGGLALAGFVQENYGRC